MSDWLIILIIVVVWAVLQYIVFPKLGVPTWRVNRKGPGDPKKKC